MRVLSPSEKSLGWERLRTTEICAIDLSRSQPSFYRIAFFKRLTEGCIEWDRLNICTIVGSRYKPILLVLLYTICLIWVAFIGLDCKGWERLQMVPTTGNEHTPLLPLLPAPLFPVPPAPICVFSMLPCSLCLSRSSAPTPLLALLPCSLPQPLIHALMPLSHSPFPNWTHVALLLALKLWTRL